MGRDPEDLRDRNLPHVPLFFRAEPHVIPKWLKGYVTTGHGDLVPLWAENWRAE